MFKKSAGDQKKSFSETIESFHDEQLIACLRKRDHYQKEAVDLAIQEAIKRNIIRSEEDLLSPRFRSEPVKSKLFPNIENTESKRKIKRSIGRSLFITGIIPVILGLFRLKTGFNWEGIVALSFGIIWIAISAWMIRKINPRAVKVLLIMTGLSFVFFLSGLVPVTRLVLMDWFIIVVIYLLVIYGLIFVLKLEKQT
ncbi:MAG: hypothetical protein WCY58_07430 [Mariniphaga sp.]|nr:hypothetical protein [Mariniphaga sp.]MDD4225272.1 hypothetical protein [Mariniphaga sp.]MDD4424846.1 hypothetical protein [Mariniphaga sp.]